MRKTSEQSDIGRQPIYRHNNAWVKLELADRDIPVGYHGEWVRAEIIGIDNGHLRVMILDKPMVPHGFKKGDELTVLFEELDDASAAIWLVPAPPGPAKDPASKRK